MRQFLVRQAFRNKTLRTFQQEGLAGPETKGLTTNAKRKLTAKTAAAAKAKWEAWLKRP